MTYPDDFMNTVVCGDSLPLVAELPDCILDGVVIDPPYGESMGYSGDQSVWQSESLLADFLKIAIPKIKANGHVAIFWTMRNLDVCIDTLRSSGLTYRRTLSMYIPSGNARPHLGWLPRTQAIVIGQKYLPTSPAEFHEAMTHYLNQAIADAGITKAELARRLGCDSRLVMKWTRVGDPAWCLPTQRFYKPLKEILALDNTFDILLHRESPNVTNKRDDFSYCHDTYVVSDRNSDMLHPSQKPLSVVEHLVTCLAPTDGIILDGFAGSGTTAVACRNTNRNFVAIEISGEFCDIARQRLSN